MVWFLTGEGHPTGATPGTVERDQPLDATDHKKSSLEGGGEEPATKKAKLS